MFSLIAAIGKNNELGKKGQLCFHLKEDLNYFRRTTIGHQIVMGRKTWESLPGKLPGRTNIVISRHSVPEADVTINKLPEFIAKHKDSPEEIFIIGGGLVYSELLPYAKYLYLTEIDISDSAADSYFPNFDKSLYHQKLIKKGAENGLTFSITKYEKLT